MISKAKSAHTKSSAFITMSMLPSTVKGSGVYEYNGFNQLVRANESGTISTYTYDADGLRQSKTVAGVTTNHIWDGTNMVAETNGSGAVTNVYTRGMQLISMKSGNNVSYYIHNGHGDVTALMDASGNVTKEYAYDAFGVEENISSNDTNPFRYCGEYYDKESGNIYLRARYYDTTTGRFISEDPIRDGLNWYSYCGGNSVMFVDPLGLWEDGDDELSTPAQVYIDYYTEQWNDANIQYTLYNGVGDTENAAIQKAKMDEAHDKAKDIRRLDAQGQVTGVVYDVPLYWQHSLKLCWAYCQVMIEHYQQGINSQEEADKRAQEIAQSIHGNSAWNTGGFPTNSSDVVYNGNGSQSANIRPITNIKALDSELANGPIYAGYESPQGDGHAVVVTGAVSAENHESLVLTNNPWGDANVQTFDEFKSGIPRDLSGLTLKGVMRVR